MEVRRHHLEELKKNTSRKFVLSLLCLVLFIKAIFVVCAILNAGIGLGPDEAQYWTWSQQLAFGYYSKPPAIAWQIWIGTHLFGDTELGVRFGALVIGTLLPLSVYVLGRAAELSRMASFWAAMVIAWSPLGMAASFLAITDGGMVLFWTLAAASMARTLNSKANPSYYVLGFLIACGALFKWVMYEFWVVVFLMAVFLPHWRSRHLLGGFIISLLGLIPSVFWSAGHDWATFRHVGATMWTRDNPDVGATPLLKGNFFDFFGAQAALLSPILFILFLASVWMLWRRRRFASRPMIFCGLISVGFIAVYLLIAFFKKMQGNWVDFAYPAAAVLIAWRAWDNSARMRPWLVGGIALSGLLCAFVFLIPVLESENLSPIGYKQNPFKHNVGWRELGLELTASGYDPSKHFLLSDRYQGTSILYFYGPGQKRAYFLNLQGIRKNQFSYWPTAAEDQKGKTGYFVAVENWPLSDSRWKDLTADYQHELSPFFDDVRFLGIRPIFYSNGEPVKGAMIFKGVRYNGEEPIETQLY